MWHIGLGDDGDMRRNHIEYTAHQLDDAMHLWQMDATCPWFFPDESDGIQADKFAP
ncbi:MAG: hypothetical protein M5U34_09715 [Chloroflexi bacterium]|nr:hypothetical protein [Chloroflexota bacterium]